MDNLYHPIIRLESKLPLTFCRHEYDEKTATLRHLVSKTTAKVNTKTNTEKKTVTVIGGTGLIGSHLIKQLLDADFIDRVISIGRSINPTIK